MGDCLWTFKPSWYKTNTKVNSAFHPSRVGKSSRPYQPLWLWLRWGTFTSVGCDPIWQVMLRT